jgi:homoserine O-acetyltransferase
MQRGSVGISTTSTFTLAAPLLLESGASLFPVQIAYETYGTLNFEKSNAILVCHALTGDAHAAGHHGDESRPGWWDGVIGPGKAFDTDRYFVICSNVLGGCKGTTGPASIDPDTGKPYGTSFPVVTIRDMVNAQKALIDHLGISQLFAVAGGSMGGMQVLQWMVTYPSMVRKAIAIAATGSSTPQQIAFNEVGRKAITADPAWCGGDYYGKECPVKGLSLARMVAHITYLSDASMHTKFGRALQDREFRGFDFETEFQVESYLHHQGTTFTKRFDANSYLYLTKAVDYFDLSQDDSLISGLASTKATVMIISVTSDWLYPPYQSQEIVSALSANECDVHYCELRSQFGHDAFLIETGQLNYSIGRFLDHTLVRDVMITQVPVISEQSTIATAARMMITQGVNHLPVLAPDQSLVGIVTSWDIANAVACGYTSLDQIMSSHVITATGDETIEAAASRMEQHRISALPVIDQAQHVIGLISSDGLSTLIGRSP